MPPIVNLFTEWSRKEEVNSDYVGLENNGSNNGRFEKRLEGHVALLV